MATSESRSGRAKPRRAAARGEPARETAARKPASDEPLREEAHATASADLAPVVGANLRRLRVRRGLSLEGLAQVSGVSRAMLGQVELGQSAPTINVLWKIARALDVTFSALISSRGESGAVVLRAEQSKLLSSHDGSFVSRALFPFDKPRRVEFYELHLAGRQKESATAHPSGTTENLVVTAGAIDIHVANEIHHLDTGDSILFEADVPHIYANPGKVEAVMYLVMTYAEETV